MRLAVAASVAVLLIGDAGRAQTPEQLSAVTPEQLAIVRQLGPDGFASAPPLPTLVDGTAVAIVGRVLGTDGFDHRDGYASVIYRLAVDEVLFSRNIDGVPRLAPGTVIRVEQRGRGDLALRYFAGKLPPVASEDTCLLFLTAQAPGLSLMGWTVHFRSGSGPVPVAETLGPASLAAEMAKPYWFGPAVRMVETPRGAAPEWVSLLAEVRRLGTVDPSPTRQR